jgi:protein TonB
MTNSGYQNSPLDTPLKHPIPGGSTRVHSTTDARKGIILSALLHMTLALLGWNLISSRATLSTVEVTRLYDIEVVPLSALETSLPKGAPTPKPPEAARQELSPQHTVEREKETKVVSPLPRVTQSSREPSSARAATPSDPKQTLGVPNGEATGLEQARINYQDMVASLLARAKRYPERALRRRMTGDATIRIEIAADGSLSEFDIIQSTESPILDEELKAMVDRAAPFPAFPPDLRKQSLALVVPITFKLDG